MGGAGYAPTGAASAVYEDRLKDLQAGRSAFTALQQEVEAFHKLHAGRLPAIKDQLVRCMRGGERRIARISRIRSASHRPHGQHGHVRSARRRRRPLHEAAAYVAGSRPAYGRSWEVDEIWITSAFIE